jgi:hypothetical protein
MEQEKEKKESKDQEKEIPLCLNCLQPVDPLQHICPHCGRAIGQFTPIMPFEGLRWQADIWGKMWNQIWSNEISFAGKLLRLLMIAWLVPILLIGVIPKLWEKQPENENHNPNTDIKDSIE